MSTTADDRDGPAGRAALGHGLALASVGTDSIGMDLVWRSTPEGDALALVEGVDNLAQDLTVALLTPTGSAVLNRTFGFDGLRVLTLGVPAVLAEELLRLAVVRTLVSDARVREVLEVAVEPVRGGDPGDPGARERRQVVRAQVRVLTGATVELVAGEVELPRTDWP